METVIQHATPLLLPSTMTVWIFLLLPAFGALLGAFVCQGSFLRIIGAAFGAAGRDLAIMLLVINGYLLPNNPHWSMDISFILAYLSASTAALLSCLSPYRGKLLLLNSAVGGFAGQFILPYLLGKSLEVSALETSVRKAL